jgi:hypothetical protein
MGSRITALLLPLALVLGGCAKRQEEAGKPVLVDLKGHDKCLSDMSDKLTQFFDGKLTPNEVAAFWDCVAADVKEFRDLTRGEGADGSYSAEAIKKFLEHYFIKNHTVTPGLLSSMMQLKRVFLSGSVQWLTPAELDRVQDVLMTFKDLSLKIQPHTGVLFNKQNQATDSEIRAASAALQAAMAELSGWLSKQNQSYPLDQFALLTSELEKWFESGGNSSKIMANLQKASQVLPDAKGVLIGGNKAVVAGSEWNALFNVLSQGYFFYLSCSYGFADSNVDAGLNRAVFPEGLAKVADVLKNGAVAHPKGEIPLADWKQLLQHVQDTQWLPDNITADAMYQFLSWLLKRGFGDGVTAPTGMNLGHIAAFHKISDNWTTLLGVPPTDPQPLSADFNKMLSASPSFIWDQQGRITMVPGTPPTWSDPVRRRMVWPYVIVRWLKEAYVGVTASTLSEDQVVGAVREILPLIKNFGWLLDVEADRVAKRRMREADLFTMASNGDEQLDINEATRFLALTVSSDRVAQIWLKQSDLSCGGRKVDCLRSLLMNPSLDVMNSMPHLLAVGRVWPAGKLIDYMKNSELAALGAIETGDWNTADLLETVQIMEYVETFLERFDTDHSETINLQEALNAFPVFGPTLTHLLAGLPAEQSFALFTFMLKYGDTPFTMFGGPVLFNQWRWKQDDQANPPVLWKFEADRNALMGILAALSRI